MFTVRRVLVSAFAILGCLAATAVASPRGITAGPDGNVWFTESDTTAIHGDRIGVITPEGVVREFWRGIRPEAGPDAIAPGPDGNLWFTESFSARIGRITPAGRVSEFSQGFRARGSSIAAGPDGRMWFIDPPGQIGAITTSGVVKPIATAGCGNPSSITAGPDGNMWFACLGEDGQIVRITPSGRVTSFEVVVQQDPDFGSITAAIGSITAGPDGNLWFTEPDRDRVGRITPAGVITEFSRGITRCSSPWWITRGADGNLWFTEPGDGPQFEFQRNCRSADRIGRITPSGEVSEFSASITSPPDRITAGSDGNLWFTEPGANRIGRITPTGAVAEFPPRLLLDRVRPVRNVGVSVRVRCASCRSVVRLRAYTGEFVGARRFAARTGHPARFIVPLSSYGRVLLAARGELGVSARVDARPGLLLGSQDSSSQNGNLVRLRRPAAIRGKAVDLRVTRRLRAKLRAAYLARQGASTVGRRVLGPLPGSTHYARLGRGEWAIATFSHPLTGTTDQPEAFNRPIGGRWVDIGDTGGGCPDVPRPVLLAWHLQGCE